MNWKKPWMRFMPKFAEGGLVEEAEPVQQGYTQEQQIDQVQNLSSEIAGDPGEALSQSRANIVGWESQVSNLAGQLPNHENPEIIQAEIDRLASLIQHEQPRVNEAERLLGANTATAQSNLMSNVYTDPASVMQRADVAVTPITAEQLMDPLTVGQAGDARTGGRAQQVTASTVDSTATMDDPNRVDASLYDADTISDDITTTLDGVEAATATASSAATVRGQLEMLMEDFEGGGTPPWASGPMRRAMQMMQTRGMGASSVAGQAVVQAAMESALVIAQQDASTNAQFEMKNLDNRQQTLIFTTQQRTAALFSDQAAINASRQFNASSENQTEQFFTSMEQNASQFNASQINAIQQFNSAARNNVNMDNAQRADLMKRFNAEQANAMARFNAQNQLVVSQANAQWMQSVATADTAATNLANFAHAKDSNQLTLAAYDSLVQRDRDIMDYAFTNDQRVGDEASRIALAKLQISANDSAQEKTAIGNLIGAVVGPILGTD